MPSRKQWYFCPHWERFLVKGAQECLLCEPPRQAPSPQPAHTPRTGKSWSLRSIFPILDDRGDPLQMHTSEHSLAS